MHWERCPAKIDSCHHCFHRWSFVKCFITDANLTEGRLKDNPGWSRADQTRPQQDDIRLSLLLCMCPCLVHPALEPNPWIRFWWSGSKRSQTCSVLNQWVLRKGSKPFPLPVMMMAMMLKSQLHLTRRRGTIRNRGGTLEHTTVDYVEAHCKLSKSIIDTGTTSLKKMIEYW